MNNTLILDLEQKITIELKAAKHENSGREPYGNLPLDGTLPDPLRRRARRPDVRTSSDDQ
jgi:hypothetical protein